MPGKLAPMLDYAATALATRVQPEWPSISNASAPLLAEILRRIVQSSRKTKVTFAATREF